MQKLRLDEIEELLGVVRVTGENGFEVAVAQVFGNNFAENASVIRRNGEVASLIELPFAHSRPA